MGGAHDGTMAVSGSLLNTRNTSNTINGQNRRHDPLDQPFDGVISLRTDLSDDGKRRRGPPDKH